MRKIVLLSLLLLTSINLFSKMGERRGFILGLGLGGAYSTFTQTAENSYVNLESDRANHTGLGTDFYLGYAPSNNLEVYCTSKEIAFIMENALNNDVLVISSIGGVGLSYYLNSYRGGWSPGPFFSGSLGISKWSVPFELDAEPWVGIGATVGIGYEFLKHFSVLIDLMVSNPSITESGTTFTTNFTGIKITLVGMAY